MIPNPNDIRLLSIRKGGVEHFLSKFGFRIYASDFSRENKNSYKQKFSEFVKSAKSINPHIFYFFKDDNLPSDFFQTLRHELPKTKFIMRYWDQRGTVPDVIKGRRGCIDTLILNNRDARQYKMYKNFGIKGIRTLYNTTDEHEFFPLDVYRPYCLFFGGSNYNNKFPLSKFRHGLIQQLRKRFKMLVYGRGWGFGSHNPVRRQAYSNALQLSHINIGVNHYHVRQYYSERTIQNPASGRLHITYYIPRMELDFGPNHHNIVWFKSVEECIDVVKYYLAHDDKRAKVEQRGRELILNKFGTYKWTQIFANIMYQTLGYKVPTIDY